MTHRRVGLSLLASAFVAPTLQAQYPTSPPPAGAIQPAEFPPFQEAHLPNGMTILLVESHRQPVLSLTLSVPAGDAYDPNGKEGLAGLVAGLLTKGTPTRSADDIAAAIEGAGGSLGASTNQDFLTIRANSLAGDAKLAMSLLAESIIHPLFPESELELLRKQTLSGLQLALSQPASIAQRIFDAELYTPHPYGRAATEPSVTAITREDLESFHAQRVTPDRALLVVAGAISLSEVQALARTAFGDWTGSGAERVAFPPPPSTHPNEIVLVHRPGSVQSNIIIGNTTFTPRDPNLFAATMANQVLGGGADARLFLILREQKSWTYGAYSSLANRHEIGSFSATAEVRTEVTDSALTEMLVQLDRIRTESVTMEELEAAKGSLVGSFPLSIETASQVASAVTRARLNDLPSDYLATYRTRLSAITAGDIQRVSQRAIRPAESVIVVVGDATKLAEPLEKIRPVKLLNADGSALARADLGLQPGGLSFNATLLEAFSDSFAILVQGNAMGGQRITLAESDSGLVYSDNLNIGGFVQQQTRIVMTPDGVVQHLTQSGQIQGQPTSVVVAYSTDGRVTGHAKTMSATGIKEIDIDTTITAGTIDDNMVQVLVRALAWGPDAKWSFSAFSAGQANESVQQLSVKAVESVTVPAGTFEAYRAELVGGPTTITMWISTANPHRLLKLAPAGQPVEIVFVQ